MVHILNGDCLHEQLKQSNIQGTYIIFREFMVVGEVNAANITEFWDKRATFISKNYDAPYEDYFDITVSEMNKILQIPDDTEVYLWFENDLFCQVNMWFVLSQLADRPNLKIYRVLPIVQDINDIWKGFGISTSEMLELSMFQKILFSPQDILLGIALWSAYQTNNLLVLEQLANKKNECFPYLKDVCKAQADRFPLDGSLGKPEKILKEILTETNVNEFEAVFSHFSVRAGIYGYGDIQVKKMIDLLLNN